MSIFHHLPTVSSCCNIVEDYVDVSYEIKGQIITGGREERELDKDTLGMEEHVLMSEVSLSVS